MPNSPTVRSARWPYAPSIAILFGAYFLRGFFVLVVMAAVGAYLFSPLFNGSTAVQHRGLSATLTLLAAIAVGYRADQPVRIARGRSDHQDGRTA